MSANDTKAQKLVLCNANLYPCDGKAPFRGAIGIIDDCIAALGDYVEVMNQVGVGATTIDMNGNNIFPGFIDTHNHLSEVGLSLLGINIRGISSISDLQDVLRDAAKRKPAGEWLVTGVVGENAISHELRERRYPSADDLDAVVEDHPVCVRAPHVGILNSRAMELLHLNETTACPVGGRIGASSDGKNGLDGRFYETAWSTLVEPNLPRPDLNDRTAAICAASREFAAVGLTGVCEHGLTWDTWRAYQAAEAQGGLLQHVFAHLRVGPGSEVTDDEQAIAAVADERRKCRSNSRAVLGGVKVFIDGGVALGTAYFKRAYRTTYGEISHGVQVTTLDRLREISALCALHDLQLSQHVSGDAAIEEVLDAYTALHDPEAVARNRFILVHCQFPTSRDIDRIRDFGAHIAAQTLFIYNMGEGYLKFQGDRGRQAVPLRTFLAKGCRVGLGTDAPVNQYQPTIAMWHAQSRLCKALGTRFCPEESIGPMEALSLYTKDAAYFNFMENRTGTLATGKSADLVVYPEDPISSHESLDDVPTRASCTMIAGKVVHGDLPRSERFAASRQGGPL